MFLYTYIKKEEHDTFLCLRRGVSEILKLEASKLTFSLPTQRCFLRRTGRPRFRRLFSAYAEVFPNPSGLFSQPHAFLCLRRGVSELGSILENLELFSLPTQRCFLFTRKVNERRRLFSAYAEVFLPRAQKRPVPHPFLCLRRGVSR